MKRIIVFSTAVLLATMGADGSSAGLCGTEMAPSGEEPVTDDVGDGGTMADSGGTPDAGGMGGSSGKQPHLINTVTGEDLGLLIDLGTLTVFSERLNSLITLGATQPNRSVEIYFSEQNCNGDRYIMSNNLNPPTPKLTNQAWVMGPQATYLRPVGSPLSGKEYHSLLKQAGLDLDGRVACQNSDGRTDYLQQYVDTGVRRRPPDSQLKVELR